MSTPAGDDLVGNATIRVDGDTDPATRALARFSRDAQGRIRDVRGRFVSESALINRTITTNTPTLTINTTPATNALNQFTRDANGRLRDVQGRFVTGAGAINNSLTTAAGGGDRFNFSLRGVADAARGAAGVLGRVGIGVAGLGAAAGSAAPLLAGIVTTLQNIAPAGAVAVTGMLAIQQASAVVQLGMVGVGDAIGAALDPSKAEEFNEALEKLAPNARAFAVAVKGLQPDLAALQQGVQNRLFQGFGDELQRLSSAALPVVRQNLNATALTLNRMALGASVAARELATSGTLGKAMAGANTGLGNLAQIPGQVVTGLGQLAAAGAPAFDRITAAAARAATGISERLSTAFESGALTDAVNTAVDLLRDLGTVAGNVFGILGNVMAPLQAEGAGLIGVLVEITGVLRDATATQGFQDAIGAVAGVMGTLARTVGPLLGQALAAIGPIFTALGPPVERLITSLGTALSPIITALGPVLGAAATAVGVLVDAFSPLLPVIGNLVASLLPPLVPVINAVAQAWAGAAPIVAQLGQILTAVLAPIIAQLPAILAPVIATFTQLTSQILPIVAQLLVALTPALASLGQAFGQLLVAVAPLLTSLGQLIAQSLRVLVPVLTPIITLVGQLASILAGQLASTITNVVVPAFRVVTSLLRGDFTGAWNSLKALFSGVWTHITTTMNNIRNVISSVIRGIISIFRGLYNTLIGNSIIPDLVNGIRAWFGRLPGMVFSALRSLASGLVQIATTALSRFRSAVVSGATATVSFVRGIPGRIRGALASLGGLIASVATAAFNRFRAAISSGASQAISVARGIPGRIRGALGGLGSLLYSAGRSIIQGLINGIRNMAGNVRSAVNSVLSDARDLLPFSPAKKGPFSGKGWTLYSGRSISEALAQGIAQRENLVQRAARVVAEGAQSTVSMAVSPARGGPAAAGTGALQVGTAATRLAAMTPLGVSSMRTAGIGATVINNNYNTFENHGVIGSQIEVDNWLAKSMDRLNRTNRLPKTLGSRGA